MLLLAINLLYPMVSHLKWQLPISRERVHYIYELFVRVEAAKVPNQLNWHSCLTLETLLEPATS